jgi:hypothetical protein
MRDPRSYRDNAVDCLLAALNCPPYLRKFNLSLAAMWFSLARRDDIIGGLLTSRDTTKPVKMDRRGAHPRPLLYLVK